MCWARSPYIHQEAQPYSLRVISVFGNKMLKVCVDIKVIEVTEK
jgi:hypothetical protein